MAVNKETERVSQDIPKSTSSSTNYNGGDRVSQDIPKSTSSSSSSSSSSDRVSQDIPKSTSSSSSSSGSKSGSSSSSSSNNGYTAADPNGSDYYANQAGMSAKDQAALKAAGDAYNNAKTEADRQLAHAEAEAIREKYNYSGGTDGSQYISGQKEIKAQPEPNTPDFTGILDQWLSTAKKQPEAKIGYATDEAVTELERAKQDAEVKFQTQQNQVSIDEAKALDNQALYAERRGDKGGIGAVQYASVQNAAAQSRREINTARTKLATDTARQIADLRAQGEFEKADALLTLSQNYLTQLMSLQQWSAEYNLDLAQYNTSVQQWQQEFSTNMAQWQQEFNLSVADLMGEYNGVQTLEAARAEKSDLAAAGAAALSVGVRPSASQQAALGYTDQQINAALASYKLERASGASGSRSGSRSRSSSSSSSGSGSASDLNSIYAGMYAAGVNDEMTARQYLRQLDAVSNSDVVDFAEDYMNKYDSGAFESARAASDAPLDMASVWSAGFGMYSAEGLADEVAKGNAEIYLGADGYRHVRRTASNRSSGSLLSPVINFGAN